MEEKNLDTSNRPLAWAFDGLDVAPVFGPFDFPDDFDLPFGFDRCRSHGEALVGSPPYCPTCREEKEALVETGGEFGLTVTREYERLKDPAFIPASARALVDDLIAEGMSVEVGTSASKETRPPIATGPNRGTPRPDLEITWTSVQGRGTRRAVAAVWKNTGFDHARVITRGERSKLLELKRDLDSWIEEA